MGEFKKKKKEGNVEQTKVPNGEWNLSNGCPKGIGAMGAIGTVPKPDTFPKA